jgi:DNA-binding LacI/PurR family transcriptional regulator
LIAVLGYPDKLRIDRDKLNGYYDAFLKNGLEIPEKYVYKLSGEEPADIAIENILNMKERPTAFFGICDSYAMEFINKAHTLGLKVPDDIAVAGMDNLDIAQYFKPSLTTVKTPFSKLGVLAVDNLLQLINHDLGSIKTIVKHRLFIRESS